MPDGLTPGGEPADIDLRRLIAYRRDSDPLFFKAHAGELGTLEEGLALWQEAREAVKDAYPKDVVG